MKPKLESFRQPQTASTTCKNEFSAEKLRKIVQRENALNLTFDLHKMNNVWRRKWRDRERERSKCSQLFSFSGLDHDLFEFISKILCSISLIFMMLRVFAHNRTDVSRIRLDRNRQPRWYVHTNLIVQCIVTYGLPAMFHLISTFFFFIRNSDWYAMRQLNKP